MPRTAIAVQSVQRNKGAQLASATPDVGNGNSFVNDGKTVLVVTNRSGVTVNVTVRSVACSHGRTLDVVVPVVAGADGEVGPFDINIFNQADGTVNVDWDVSASIKVTPRSIA